MAIIDTYRRLALPVYLPSLLVTIAHQALPVLLPLYVLQLGHSPVAAAIVVGCQGFGMMLFDLPAGAMATRLGDKPLMLVTLSMMFVAVLGYTTVTGFWSLCVVAVFYGAGTSGWLLARLSYITDGVPSYQRGRAISIVAGSMRVGAMLGPLWGGVAAKAFGYQAAFLGVAAMSLIGVLLVSRYAKAINPGHEPEHPHWDRIRAIIANNRRVLATAGLVSVAMMLSRSARALLIPLFGDSIGLDVATIGLVYSIGSMLDMLLFYPAGMAMDRYGRKSTGIPGIALLGLALGLLPLAHGFYSLLAITCLAGIGNGLTTGIVMTIGSDLSPPQRRAEFLSVWRLMSDLGHTSAPFLIGTLVKIASLAVSALAAGAIGMAGAVVLLLCVKETLSRDNSAGD
jgi:MFS family permease